MVNNLLRSRVTSFVGGYGSGKSEIALNLAIQLAEAGSLSPVLVDLDVVKPMFRTREHAKLATALGVEIVAPEGDLALTELAALNPRIFGAFSDETRMVLMDIGGDDRGARALGSLRDALPREHEMLLVVNARRPFSADVAGMVQVANEIEEACRMKISALVSNTHLAGWTNADVVLEGHKIALAAAKQLGVPVRFLAARRDIVEKLSVEVPVLAMDLRFCLPWEKEIAERV